MSWLINYTLMGLLIVMGLLSVTFFIIYHNNIGHYFIRGDFTIWYHGFTSLGVSPFLPNPITQNLPKPQTKVRVDVTLRCGSVL